MSPDLGKAAAWYSLHLGWSIFPCFGVRDGACTCGKGRNCQSPGKHPRIRGGLLGATLLSVIEEWWAKWPDANIALAIGGGSKVDVVDVDPRHGGDETLWELERTHGEIPATVTSLTGGGGCHLFFRHVNGLTNREVAPGVDLKTTGGYVVLPPSMHASGRRYAWEGAGRPNETAIAPWPAWLLELARGRENGQKQAAPVADKIPSGQRNATLASLAGSMRRRGMGSEEILAALLKVNERRCEPPLPAAEVRQIAESVSRYTPKVSAEPPAKPEAPRPRPKLQRPQQPQPRIVTLSELAGMDLPKPTFLIENIITGPGAWSLIGSHKSGKTLFAAQLALSYHAGAHFLDYYKTLESRGALFIEQDDPAGLATVRDILDRSPIPKDPAKFFTVEHANFTIGDQLITFLEREIRDRDLGLIVLDSYTRMRPVHGAGIDIVKAEAATFGILDELAKKTGCVILILHHRSRGNAALDWSEQTAGTFAIGMATEGEIHISRFRDLSATAPERLIQIRGRRFDGLEAVIRFRPASLDYEFVIEGAAANLYPSILEIKRGFGQRTFTPKDLSHELGMARTSAYRLTVRLLAAGILGRQGYGEYGLTEAV
ncbi:MAG: bifunctional DNA primase/polymerase [Acidobacteriota bacterium]